MNTGPALLCILLLILLVAAYFKRLAILGREEPAGDDYAKVRRRMGNLAGRGHRETRMHVMPAMRMAGWVWFTWTRRASEPLVERSGWAPFKRMAERHARQSIPPKRKRETQTS